MPKPITPDVVVAYSLCPRKAYLLLCTEEHGVPHEYQLVVAADQRRNQASFFNSLTQTLGDHPDCRGTHAGPRRGDRAAVVLKAPDCEAYCDHLTPALRQTAARGRRDEPTLVTGTHRITHDQRLALLFVGYVLGQPQSALPSFGSLLGLDGRVHKLSLDERRYSELRAILDALRLWLQALSPHAPPVVLNRHCSVCQFRADCRAQAERDDGLSLLERMTPRARRRYHERGTFSVTQLSYMFRPRRKRKPSSGSAVKTFSSCRRSRCAPVRLTCTNHLRSSVMSPRSS